MGDLKVTFSDAEFTSIRQAADALGMTAEQFVRLAVTVQARRSARQDRAAAARSILAGQTRAEGSPSTATLREIRDGRRGARRRCERGAEWYLKEDGTEAALSLLGGDRPLVAPDFLPPGRDAGRSRSQRAPASRSWSADDRARRP